MRIFYGINAFELRIGMLLLLFMLKNCGYLTTNNVV